MHKLLLVPALLLGLTGCAGFAFGGQHPLFATLYADVLPIAQVRARVEAFATEG